MHRDIKPGNILLTVRDGEERAYLTDFGLAKRSSTMAELTVAGSLVGTADYMAPEQVNGDPADARTDVYALGCVFFQMLTGKVPYERETTLATMFAHVHDPPPVLEAPLVDEYPEFTPVVQKAMAKKPDDRYLSAGDLARDAAAALERDPLQRARRRWWRPATPDRPAADATAGPVDRPATGSRLQAPATKVAATIRAATRGAQRPTGPGLHPTMAGAGCDGTGGRWRGSWLSSPRWWSPSSC